MSGKKSTPVANRFSKATAPGTSNSTSSIDGDHETNLQKTKDGECPTVAENLNSVIEMVKGFSKDKFKQQYNQRNKASDKVIREFGTNAALVSNYLYLFLYLNNFKSISCSICSTKRLSVPLNALSFW